MAFRAFQFYLKTSIQREKFIKVLISGSFPVFISIIAQYHFNIFGPLSTLNGLIVWFQKPLVLDNRLANVGISAYLAILIIQLIGYLPSSILNLFIFKKTRKILKKIILFLLLAAIIYFLILTDSRNGFFSIF